MNANYFIPTRERDHEQVEVLVRDVQIGMGIRRNTPNFCNALRGRPIQRNYSVEIVDRVEPNGPGTDSVYNRYTYSLMTESGLSEVNTSSFNDGK